MPDYQNDLLINEHKLDEEWITQPSKMMSYSADLAQAIFNRNRAKENLDVIEASLDSEARQEPTPAGLGKATETAIKNWIKLQETYREALEAYHDSDLEVNLLQGGVNAFQHRKTALENLVKLYLSGYWSEPNIGAEAKPLRERGEARITEDLNAALNRPEEQIMYTIGPEKGGYTAGPFPSFKQAMDTAGKAGEYIFQLAPNQPPEMVRFWHRENWKQMAFIDKNTGEFAPKPTPRPIPIPRRKPQ